MAAAVDFDSSATTASEVLDVAEAMEPGPLQQTLLMTLNPTALSATDAVRYLTLHARVGAWWASLQVQALVAAAGPSEVMSEFLIHDAKSERPMDSRQRTIRIADAAREELSAALRLSPSTAQSLIDEARLLASSLEATREALERGEISSAHVRIVCQAAQRLSSHLPAVADDADDRAIEAFAGDCEALQRRVLPVARRQGLSRTRRCADRAVQSIDAAGQAARRASARCTRDVRIADTTDGITTLIARLDALSAQAIMAAIHSAASEGRITDSPRIGERRADALAALVLGVVAAPGDSTSPVRSVTVNLDVQLDVAIPLATFLSTDEAAPVPITLSDDTVLDLPDITALLADEAVRVHARPVVIDDHHPLDLGRRRYAVSDALRRFLIARDRTCRFPGCSRSAARCQMDHAQAWDDGGQTDVANLGALCTRHHQLKTHAGWQISASARDGTCTWTSPQGRSYDHNPPPF